jgi:hypothetical protein
MDPRFVTLRNAVLETKTSYYRLWRMIIAHKVAALKVRKQGGRRTVWYVNLPSVMHALEQENNLGPKQACSPSKFIAARQG